MRRAISPASARFSMVELMTVTVIVSITAALLLPAVSKAKDKAEYGRWQGQKSQMRGDDGLVLHYDFEEVNANTVMNQALGHEVENYTPEHLDGRIVQSYMTTEGRWPGKPALYLSGQTSSAYLGADSTTGMNPNTGSVIVWCKRGEGGFSSFSKIFSADYSDSSVYYGLSLSVDSYRGAIQYSISDVTDAVNDYEMKVGEWVMVTLTWDHGTAKAYINGVLKESKSYVPMTAVASAMSVGNSCYYSPSFGISRGGFEFTGWIDEVAIYSRSLNAQEVADFYRNGLP